MSLLSISSCFWVTLQQCLQGCFEHEPIEQVLGFLGKDADWYPYIKGLLRAYSILNDFWWAFLWEIVSSLCPFWEIYLFIIVYHQLSILDISSLNHPGLTTAKDFMWSLAFVFSIQSRHSEILSKVCPSWLFKGYHPTLSCISCRLLHKLCSYLFSSAN